MCGIAGWIDWQRDLTHEGPAVEQMAERVSHRGPDEQGTWLCSRAALAHRRLIVIDAAGGKQPMCIKADGRTYTLTYNGEIYNFLELRAELERRGHVFRSRSDTEVLLRAYIQWQEECVGRLNGIFAFGLWDEHRQRLLLARDHLGVKPLFYAQRGSAVLFGSELKVLLAHPSVKPEIDALGLSAVLEFTRAPGAGIFRDTSELRAGHTATFTRDGMRLTRYWTLQSTVHTDSLDATTERVRTLVEDSARRQVVADTPVAAMLSGGLDSSALTALIAKEFKQHNRPLQTYSIDFVGSDQDFLSTPVRPSLDGPWARQVSAYVSSEHHTVTVDTPDLLNNLLLPMRMRDVPCAGQIDTSLYFLCKAIKANATVGISGESADEVFGGYRWFHSDAALSASTFPWLARMALARSESGQNSVAWVSPDVAREGRLEDYVAQLYVESLAEVPRLEGESSRAARMREVFYLSLAHFLPMMLERMDRMSMAAGYEVRVPFCDHRIVEYVWNIPWEMKAIDGVEKGLLRRAMIGVLPEDVRNRPKSAYPASQSKAYQKGLRDWVLRILQDGNAPIQPFIDATAIRPVAEGTAPIFGPSAGFLFERIIQVNAWLQEYRVSVA